MASPGAVSSSLLILGTFRHRSGPIVDERRRGRGFGLGVGGWRGPWSLKAERRRLGSLARGEWVGLWVDDVMRLAGSTGSEVFMVGYLKVHDGNGLWCGGRGRCRMKWEVDVVGRDS